MKRLGHCNVAFLATSMYAPHFLVVYARLRMQRMEDTYYVLLYSTATATGAKYVYLVLIQGDPNKTRFKKKDTHSTSIASHESRN